ncbi:MAG: MerR family DNA-binding transcriptional regulator [Candidatus Rokubacteria bacterium]|nr:MerR family DNA-binding transcriptional regulator [Candidatus Rokubacteria bacterium]
MAHVATRELLTVNEIAEDLGVTPRALRFYETKGLIVPQRAGTTRVYTRRDRGRLALILRGKRLGFSLADIKQYLDLYDADPGNVRQMKHLLSRVRDRLARLDEQRTALEAATAELKDIERQVQDALAERTGRKE